MFWLCRYNVNISYLMFCFVCLHGGLSIGWVVSSLTDWETGPRLALNLVFLLLANCGLISLHQMAGQFGVAGGDTDVLADEDKDEDEDEDHGKRAKKKPKPYSPPEIEMHGYSGGDVSVSEGSSSSHTDSCCEDDCVLDNDKPSFPLLQHLLSISMASRDNEVVSAMPDKIKWIQLKGEAHTPLSEKNKRQVKILLTFIFVTTFWSVMWDVFGSLPKETIIGDDGSNGDKFCSVYVCLFLFVFILFLFIFVLTDDDGDDYDRHNGDGESSSFYVMILGISYVVVAFFYLALSGELFSFVDTEDEAPDRTAESTDINVSF
jgi:hypothetical protein